MQASPILMVCKQIFWGMKEGCHVQNSLKKPAKAIRVHCVSPAATQAHFTHVSKLLTKFFS